MDLRDLISIHPAALAIFVRARAGCQAGGKRLVLLISGHASHAAIADAFAAAGLADQLEVTSEPLAQAPEASRGALARVRATGS